MQSSRSGGPCWQINLRSFSNEVTRSRAGLLMTAHFEGEDSHGTWIRSAYFNRQIGFGMWKIGFGFQFL